MLGGYALLDDSVIRAAQDVLALLASTMLVFERAQSQLAAAMHLQHQVVVRQRPGGRSRESATGNTGWREKAWYCDVRRFLLYCVLPPSFSLPQDPQSFHSRRFLPWDGSSALTRWQGKGA